LHSHCAAIAKRLQGDCNAIARRLQSHFKAIAKQELESDCKAIAIVKRLQSYCEDNAKQ
jgi:hypothetical protein